MPPILSARAQEIIRGEVRAQGYTDVDVDISLTANTNALGHQVQPHTATYHAYTPSPGAPPASSGLSPGVLSGITLRRPQQPHQMTNARSSQAPLQTVQQPARTTPLPDAHSTVDASSQAVLNANTRQPAQQPRQPTNAHSPRLSAGYVPPHLRNSLSSAAPQASNAPPSRNLRGNTQRPVQQAPRSTYTRVAPTSTAPTSNESITIRMRVGPNVAQYHAVGEIWRGFIDGEAWEIMSNGELETSSESVRGIVRRARAVLNHSERRIYVPPEVVRALSEDLQLRELVSTEYQRLSINAHPNSPIEESNRSHRYFQGCMRQILALLQRHVGTVTRLGGN